VSAASQPSKPKPFLVLLMQSKADQTMTSLSMEVNIRCTALHCAALTGTY
jgi:hypothetical protein